MSVHSGPDIQTTGLVFSYDMSSTLKSYVGEPTTNLITNPVPTSVTGYSLSGGIGSATYQPSSNSIRWYLTSYEVWGAYLNIPPAFNGTLSTTTQYSMSFEWKSEGQIGPNSVSYQLVQGNGVSPASSSFTVSSYSTDLGNGWNKFKATFTPVNTGVGDAYNRVIVGPRGTNILDFYIRNMQFEQKSYATPFVNGTRSNTQSVLDLTGVNTLTTNSLVYATDNTFSFNGTASKLTTATLPYQFLTSGVSISVVLNYTQTTANDDVISWGFNAFNATVYAWELRLRGSGNVEFSPGIGPGGSGTPARLSYTQAVPYLSGRNAFIDVTYSANGSASIYENGVLKATVDYTGVGVSAVTNALTIGQGTDSYFPGKIYQVKIYNRALSETEVRQNFNANRSRFGI